MTFVLDIVKEHTYPKRRCTVRDDLQCEHGNPIVKSSNREVAVCLRMISDDHEDNLAITTDPCVARPIGLSCRVCADNVFSFSSQPITQVDSADSLFLLRRASSVSSWFF
jgi:hypothetical protein